MCILEEQDLQKVEREARQVKCKLCVYHVCRIGELLECNKNGEKKNGISEKRSTQQKDEKGSPGVYRTKARIAATTFITVDRKPQREGAGVGELAFDETLPLEDRCKELVGILAFGLLATSGCSCSLNHWGKSVNDQGCQGKVRRVSPSRGTVPSPWDTSSGSRSRRR